MTDLTLEQLEQVAESPEMAQMRAAFDLLPDFAMGMVAAAAVEELAERLGLPVGATCDLIKEMNGG